MGAKPHHSQYKEKPPDQEQLTNNNHAEYGVSPNKGEPSANSNQNGLSKKQCSRHLSNPGSEQRNGENTPSNNGREISGQAPDV